MISIIRVFIWILVFLLIYKAIKFIGSLLFSGNNGSENHQVNYNKSSRETIKKEDVIEADFEEIEDTKTGEGK